MPTSNSRESKRFINRRNAVLKPEITDFEVLERLENERMEHERRMQELGCSLLSARKESALDFQEGMDRSQTKK